MATITAIHIPPADANSPAQLVAAVSLPQFGPAADNAHLRVEVGAGDGYEYDEQIYGGPASSPVCVSIPPPADGSPRRVRAVAEDGMENTVVKRQPPPREGCSLHPRPGWRACASYQRPGNSNLAGGGTAILLPMLEGATFGLLPCC